MKNLLNKPWFAAVLALAAILLVGSSLWPDGKGPSGGSGADAGAAAATAENEASADETARIPVDAALKALTISKTGLRDPFAHRAQAEATVVVEEKNKIPDLVDTVHLSALWTQNGTTYTLINDRICQAGDEIGRLKIESATQEGVWLTHWKGRSFVSLGGDFSLRTPPAKSTL